MKISKFGGTSVGTPERIKNVSLLINDGTKRIVVCSAMSQTTNSLFEICDYYSKDNFDGAHTVISNLEKKYVEVINELLQTERFREKAKEIILAEFKDIRNFANKPFSIVVEKSIVARGEILSTNLIQLYHEEQNIPSILLNALDFMYVDNDSEPILSEIETRLSAILAQYPSTTLFITQGFICINPRNEIDNLKRGGSDYSASLIGAAVQASVVEIWTDIDGVHNNDPRIVQNTKPIAELSFDEAAELAYFGAKILHPSTVLPAKLKNIPVLLKNTIDPTAKGTLISNKISGTGIKAIAAKDSVTVIKIKSGRMLLAYGFLRKVFEIFEKYKTPIDVITTSEVAISLTIDKEDYLAQIVDELKVLGAVEVDKNQTIVCVVGNMIAEEQGHALEVMQALGNISVRMISYGGSRHNMSIVIDSNNKEKALRSLHKNLF
ncbi:MAG TPA: aspartate kinase [Bacteroidales bacterium]|nr:aspartate kinase [Bacteroidales bacterium]